MLRFFNTLTKQIEPFEPIEPHTVRMYSCGPTVYNRAHIGNLRGFTFSDLLRRYLKFKGFRIEHVMNITDVDDKTIRDSRATGMSLADFTAMYTEMFFEDLTTLNIERVEHNPRATDHIPEMVRLIQQLLERGIAYEKGDSVYFRITDFKDYGKLSGHRPSLTAYESRIESDEYDKDDVRDFVLWKGHKEGEPYWDSPFGKGRPGWHIECSAMSQRYLGQTFDIHTGGIDLIFPHHENEIAQSEAASGNPFVRFWMHNEFLLMGDDKMSKSLGNNLNLPQILDMGYFPMAIRYFLISVHYRRIIRFTREAMDAAQSSQQRLRDFARRLDEWSNENVSPKSGYSNRLGEWRRGFEEAMDDDLNISLALSSMFDMVKETNALLDRNEVGPTDVSAAKSLLAEFDTVLGLRLFENDEAPEAAFETLIRARQEARESRNWKRADEIRDQLLRMGFAIEDTPKGTRLKKVALPENNA